MASKHPRLQGGAVEDRRQTGRLEEAGRGDPRRFDAQGEPGCEGQEPTAEEGEVMTLGTQDIALIAIAVALWLIFLFGTNVA